MLRFFAKMIEMIFFIVSEFIHLKRANKDQIYLPGQQTRFRFKEDYRTMLRDMETLI